MYEWVLNILCEMYVNESVVAYIIKIQESIVAAHLNDLLMVTRVTYIHE